MEDTALKSLQRRFGNNVNLQTHLGDKQKLIRSRTKPVYDLGRTLTTI